MTEEEISTSLDWMKTLKPNLASLDRIPLFVAPDSFSWEDLGARFTTLFQVNKFTIHPDIPLFEEQEEVTAHLKDVHYTLGILLSPHPDPIYILLSKRELVHLFCYLLGEPDAADSLEEGYLEGFLSFLTAACFDTLETLVPEEEWSFRSLGEVSVPPGEYLSFSAVAHVDDELSIYPRIAVPSKVYQTWRQRYVGLLQGVKTPLDAKVEVPLEMQVGRTRLSYEEWSGLKEGDFVVLDRLTLKPSESKGKVLITSDQKPLFRALVKPGAMKIVEHISHYEELSAMEDNEENMDEELEDEIEEEGEELEGEDLEDEIEEEEGEELEEDESEEEQEEAEEEVEEVAEEEIDVETVPTQEPTAFAKDDLSVELIIEIGRLKMTVEKLTQLQAGNVLKLDVNPESGINLVVNGKVIGRGELLSIGDLLGVRVLDLPKN